MGDIINYNVRGLKTVEIRQNKVDFLCKTLGEHNLKILSLQETRLSDKNQIPKDFLHLNHIFEIIFCGAPEQDPGSGILLFIKKTEEIIEQNIIFAGRLVHVKLKNRVTDEIFNVFSFYGKSNVNREYADQILNKLYSKIDNDGLENLIICGDFNFVTSTKDRNTNIFTSTDKLYKDVWENLQIKFNLLDAFRILSPKRRLYTFSQTGGNSKSRIDRIYISGDLSGRVEKTIFENNKDSDHKLVRLVLGKNVEMGPGTWVFNNTLLKDEVFVEEIRDLIHSYIDNSSFPNLKTTWDFLQMHIKNHTQKYSKLKAQGERKEINKVRHVLEVLESLDKYKITPDIQNEINRLRQLDSEYNDKKLQGHKIRTKIPHFEEGEGDISFFAKLEKRKGEENLIYSLEDDHGLVQEGTENLKHTIFEFYSNLYKKEEENEVNQDDLLEKVDKFVSEEEKQTLDNELSLLELEEALKAMKKSKTPGSSGLTQEFMWFYWEDLKYFFKSLVEEIHMDEALSDTQTRGIIKISYKKNGRQFIKNYRPITLLNTDLKVITKALAKRLVPVLQNIIHDSQKCIKGRKITENIHMAQDLIDCVLKDKAEAAFIFIDQEKAFDRISHNFMFKALRKFGFGENFIKWIKIIYKNVTSKVKVNGFLTDAIDIQRGVRQGCPLSALLYLICSEVLSINIRKSTNIVGFKVSNTFEHKESTYADDMKVCVTTENSIFELFKLLEKYESATNSKVNKDKTEGLWLGNWIGRTDTPLNLKWTSGEVKHLGVYVGNNRDIASQRTFEEIIEKIKINISYWNTKYISKKGKVRILNIYGLTKLWYALEIHDISNALSKEINELCKSFIWKGHYQRTLTVLCQPYICGGLALQNIDIKTKTLRIRWLENLFNQTHLKCERKVVECFIENTNNESIVGLDILKYRCNLENCITNKYYKNIYKIWLKMDILFYPTNYESIKNDWIFENMLLINNNGRVFKKPGESARGYPNYFPRKFSDLPVRVPIGDLRGIYRTLIPQINAAYHNIVFSNKEKNVFQITKSNDPEMHNINGHFREVYGCILAKTGNQNRIWENKWEIDLQNGEDIIWENIWNTVHNRISNYKVQSSIWEMIHRNYISGYILKQMNRSNGLCKLCNTIEQTRTHIFMSCNVIEQLYQQFFYIISQLGPDNISQEEKAFGLYTEEDPKINLRNYLTYSIRHIVFRSRNIDFTANAHIPTILQNKIKVYIRRDIKERYFMYKHKNKLNVFKDIYLIDNILGKIEDRELVLFI